MALAVNLHAACDWQVAATELHESCTVYVGLKLIGASRSEPHTTEFYAFRGILLGRAQRSPTWTIHLGFFVYIYIYILLLYIIDVRRTALILRWRRTARRLTAHAHRCVKLKQGQSTK